MFLKIVSLVSFIGHLVKTDYFCSDWISSHNLQVEQNNLKDRNTIYHSILLWKKKQMNIYLKGYWSIHLNVTIQFCTSSLKALSWHKVFSFIWPAWCCRSSSHSIFCKTCSDSLPIQFMTWFIECYSLLEDFLKYFLALQ